MSLIFERVLTEGIALLSYLIGDDSSGTAAVIDPRPDVDVYLERARQRKLSITHVFETHIHADYMSGARELAARTGTARVYASDEGGASYGYEHQPVRHGDTFEFGSLRLKAQHTPGHTPEMISYLAFEKKRPETPWGVFTGDTLFVNSAGRPDLLGSDEAKKLAEALYETLYGFYLELDDGVIIYPGHGHGSPCGADIGDRLESTIGFERQFNAFLKCASKDEFVEYALSTAPPEPTYYARIKKTNGRGTPVLGNLPIVPALPPKVFKEAVDRGDGILVDTSSMLGFGGGHIRGALNIGALPELSIWAGWILDPDLPILLVLDQDAALDKVVPLFLRSGFTKFAGYLTGGMKAWSTAGFPLADTPQLTVHQIKDRRDELQVVDVRSPSEWKEGHIPGAKHIFLPELAERRGEIDASRPVAVHCASGYRASLAASILKKEGVQNVANVPGSWLAWQKAGYPVEK